MKAFRNCATKAIAVVLVLAMLAAMGVGLVSVSAAGEVTVQPSLINNGDIPIKADGNDRLAMRVRVNSAFSYYSVQLASYHSDYTAYAKIALYRWDTNYAKTIANGAIHQETQKINNNSWHQQTLNSAASAGEYLIEVTGVSTTYDKGNIAWFGNITTNSITGGCVYRQGTPVTNSSGAITGEMCTKFGFTETPTSNFGSISGHYAMVSAYDSTIDVDNLQYFYRLAPTNDVVGQRIKVTSPISGFKMFFPNWGNTSSVRLSAYQWKGTYAATMASTPFATQIFTNMGDHHQCSLFFTSSMPSGEYFFAAESLSPDQPTAIYYVTSNTVSKGYSYIDGAEMNNDLAMHVYFTNGTPATPFADCTGYDDTTAGTATVPQKWEAAADSALSTSKVKPSTWVFTDGLGRVSLTNQDVGGIKSDKILGMFYWDWHLAHDKANRSKILNLQEFIEKYPEAKNLSSREAVLAATGTAPWSENAGTGYAWNEPIYGHYSIDDEWVLRRHAELLANAGVDMIFTDNSNDIITWQDGYELLFENWTKAQNYGVNVPKVMFYLPMYTTHDSFRYWTTEQLEYLYMDIYQRREYENMWFWFDGKPAIVAHKNQLNTSGNNLHKEISQFFTFRTSLASYDFKWDGVNHTSNSSRVGYWSWASVYPQPTFYANSTDATENEVEQISVSVAQNYDYSAKAMTAMNGYYVTGRSYSSADPGRYSRTQVNEYSDSSKYGYNIAEQYAYALSVNPKVVMVTGWNEWTVVPTDTFKISGVNFADQFNDEFSRDIEPTKGALKDHYYYQLVNFSRQFQGAEAMPRPGADKTIDLSADLQNQWANVEPYFGAYVGNTMDREEYGRATSHYYTDYSGRNDIIGAQVSRDGAYVYFNVECADNITPYTDYLWMNLYIDVDQSNQGWETFDFVVNKTKPTAKTAVLEKFTDGYTSEKVANVEYVVDGRYMTIKIPKGILGITGSDFTINFAWTDNVHDADDTGVRSGDKVIYSEFSGDIMDFYTSGDVAPGARFKYSYIVDDDVKLYDGKTVNDMAVTGDTEKFGQKFTLHDGKKATQVTIGFSVPDAQNDSATFSLYQWKGSYSATVAATPLYSTNFVAYNLNDSTFTIPTSVTATGTLYWEVSHAGKTFPAALGATDQAAGVVNYIAGAENGACTGWSSANTLRATVKTADIYEYSYTYINSMSKEVLYSGSTPIEMLDAAQQATYIANLNRYADADGFRAFDGTFRLASFENGMYTYYSNHAFAESVKVNGVDVALDGNNVVVETPATNNGVPFFGWKDKYGNVLSNYTTFKFYPSSASDTLEAVYQDGSTLSVGVHANISRNDDELTVTVTPIRNKGNTIVEYGYFIGVGKTFDDYGTVNGNALASIDGATKVTAGASTSAYLQRTYNLNEATVYADVSVLAYVTYRDANGTVYTYYADAETATGKPIVPSVDLVEPDCGDGGWL